MSGERVIVNFLTSVALSLDGAVLGAALAYGAARSLVRFASNAAAIRRIDGAPSVGVADLRHLLLLDRSPPSDEKLVVVRGKVESRSGAGGDVLIAQESGEKAVIVQRTLTCIYDEWKGIIGWTSDLRSIFVTRRKEESSSLRKVPFILVDGDERLIVNMDGSKQPLPLITSYHKLQPVDATPYTFLQTVFGHEYPVGLLDEEKILPIGKDISVVGVCHFKNGIPQIKSCKDLPYFLSDMTKDEMMLHLDFKTNVLFIFGISLGLLSAGVLGYAVVRNWYKWKEWRQQRQDQQAADAGDPQMADADNETGDVPEGELCVICLTRRKTSAFSPCGHMVCCHRCASAVEREVTPICPVCRQPIRNALRIYGS